jgi:DNA/RNA endonuclease YhcR with UshA esterase domain
VRCIHCGMRHKSRRSGVHIRAGIACILIAAVLLFYWNQKSRDVPLVRIGSITPLMNFTTVRVEGFLASDARMLKGGSVFYRVNDGTGILPIFMNGVADGALPKAGSAMDVEGSLSVGSGNNIRMRVLSSEQVHVSVAPALNKRNGEIEFSQITPEQKGHQLTVRGRVSRVWVPSSESKAPYKIILEDSSGVLEVIHWFKPEHRVGVGTELQISGVVELYRGKLQLKVRTSSAIRTLR